MEKVIRIGTRDSQLALWQAQQVLQLLRAQGVACELVPVKSEGDLDLVTPLYAMGVQGVFTRMLDTALLNNRIDIAVHSMKDVPVELPQGITEAAILKRGPVRDILVYKKDLDFLGNGRPAVIATGSIRRKAQWLHKYPHHRMEDLRGNVNTRLAKLASSDWAGAIFAAAGLERIGLRPAQSLTLDWMLPAPAQGAIMVACRTEDAFAKACCATLNDEETRLCTHIERDFLQALMGGCSTPISAYAYVKDDRVFFEGSVHAPDGKEQAFIRKEMTIAAAKTLGQTAAADISAMGAKDILAKMKDL